MSTIKETLLKIPSEALPENWREIGAEHFGVSVSKIEKVVYGQRKNDEIFKYMLQLAEQEKWRREKAAIDLQIRIDKLTQ